MTRTRPVRWIALAAAAAASVVTCAVGPASALAAETAAPAYTLVPLPFRPAALNNELQVVGTKGNAPSAAQLWNAGTTSAYAPAGIVPGLISDGGYVLGRMDGKSNVVVARNGQVTEVAEFGAPGGLTPSGQASFGSNSAVFSAGPPVWTASAVFQGSTLFSFTDSMAPRDTYGALDGAIVVRGENGTKDVPPGVQRDTAPSESYYGLPGSGASNVRLPAELNATALGEGGKVVMIHPFTGVMHLLTIDPGSGAIADVLPGLPAALQSFSNTAPMAVNARGRIAAEGTDGDQRGATVGTGSPRNLFTWSPAAGWVDLTAAAGGTAAIAPRVRDINGWGDVLVAYDAVAATQGPDGPDQTESPTDVGAIVKAPRAPLTGQITPIGTPGGRARGGSGRAGLAGKAVTLTGGPVDLVARTDAKGTFRLDVPEGTGYTVVAPAGSCIAAANGCHTSVPVTVGPKVAPVAFAKVAVANVASFVAKRNAAVKAVKGVASTSVKCAATNTAACKVTLTFKVGKVTYGSGTATVAKGASKAVAVKLTKAATTALVTKASIPVTATLVAKIGTKATTIVQPLRLVR